jgi:hypothetical protein
MKEKKKLSVLDNRRRKEEQRRPLNNSVIAEPKVSTPLIPKSTI